MKKLFAFLVLAACLAAPSYAQETAYGKYRTRNNIVYASASLGAGSHDLLFLSVSAGYMRQLKRHLYIGVMASRIYTSSKFIFSSFASPKNSKYRYIALPTITSLGIMAYYELPVAGRWLALRTGAGVDVGYHEMGSHSLIKDNVLPFLRAEAKWVINIAPCFHLTLSPLIVGPSYFAWSPFNYGPLAIPSLKNIWFTDMLIQFGFGFRF